MQKKYIINTFLWRNLSGGQLIKMKISIVIPAYNEEKNIERLLRDVYTVFRKNKYSGDIVVVNDCSTDKTLEICTKLKKEIKNLKIVTHGKRSGKTAAVLSGLKIVKTKYMIMIDADYQYDPKDIPKIAKKLNDYKLVSGRRIERKDPFRRLFFSYFFNLIIKKLFGIKIHDINCGLKGYLTDMLRNIEFKFSGFFIDTELLAKIHKKGIDVTEVKIRHYHRKHNASKINCIKLGIDTSINAIKLKFMLYRDTSL